jgi:hypothetical protein
MPLKKPLLTAVSSLVLLCGLAILFPTLAFAQGQYSDGSIGVDVSYPNGSATIPTAATFGIVGVAGGLTYTNNSYLAAEASHFSNLSFYVNTGLNASSTSTYYQTALAEAQASGGAHPAAYYYGYNAGQAALAYATAQGQNVKTTWWLDVETANTWSSVTTQNQQSLQGEYDALQAGGATLVGVYSTTYQWGVITGGWQNGWPSWGATALPTATQALTYSTGHEFSGGPSYLMQYRPTGAVIDYDVACLPPTVVTSFTPSTGPAGTQVTISGSGFTGATAVSFGGTAATTFTVNSSATQITATVPAGAMSGAIAVTTPAGTASSSASFTVVVQPPTLTAFAPTSGLVGSSVTLTGTKFTNATAVSFNGHAATFTVRSATQIIAHVPSGATSGTIAVTTPGGKAVSAQRFAVIIKPVLTLKLSGLASGTLEPGKNVTINGTVIPTSLSGAVTLTVQREQSGHWLAVTTVMRSLSTTGAYGWVYKPVQRATYRIKTTVAETTTHTAAMTMWQTFTVGAVKPTLTLKLTGLTSGSLKLGKILTASGKVTPTNLGGKVTLTVQREQGGHWLAVTSVLRTLITTTGAYGWVYRPTERATYRIKTTITRTVSHTAATTMWLGFAVK